MTCLPNEERRMGPAGALADRSALILAGAHIEALHRRLDRGDLSGARRHAEQARALIEDVLRPPESSSAVHVRDRLTPAELRVLVLLDSYRSLPEIATELVISRNTVKSHVRSIYAKLVVSRRSDAVREARSRGLLADTWVGRMS